MDYLGGTMVTILFLIYILLWKIKRISQVKSTGIDPEVLKQSKSNLQRFIGTIFNLVTGYAVLIIILHTINLQFVTL